MAAWVPRSLLLLICVYFYSHDLLVEAGVYDSEWHAAQATAYGEGTSGTTNGGACGYGVMYDSGYGSDTAAVSSALFKGGEACGACYEVRCEASLSKLCRPEFLSVKVTATNFCPPAPEGQAGHWCNSPAKHFDLSESAYSQIALSSAAPYSTLPVSYRRVPCTRQGGMHFTVDGHAYFNQLLLTNVAGTGQVKSVLIRGSRSSSWLPMARNWGSNWQVLADLRGQALSFKVVLSDGTVVNSYNVAPSRWQFGQTFLGNQAPE